MKQAYIMVAFIFSGVVCGQDLDLEELKKLRELNELSEPDQPNQNDRLQQLDRLKELDGLNSLEDLDHSLQSNDQPDHRRLMNDPVKIEGHAHNGNHYKGVNWSGKDLSGHTFTNVKFINANLSGVDFSGAVFSNTEFIDSNLNEACFNQARLSNSDIDGGTMVHTNFTQTTVHSSDIRADRSQLIKDQSCGSQKQARLSIKSRADLISAQEITAQLAQGTSASVDLTIHFATDSAEIKGKAHAQVYEVAKALKSPQLSQSHVQIQGHTDSEGDDEYNLDLSFRRALSVSKTLSEQHGVDAARLSIEGFGESQPITSNDSSQGRALNRRVTIVNLGQQ